MSGPAFPCTNEQFTHGNPQTGDAWSGMTLRDWFAGQAMVGILANNSPLLDSDGNVVSRTPARISRLALEVADAMLAARAK